MRIFTSIVLIVIAVVLAGALRRQAAAAEASCGDLNGDSNVNVSDAVYLLRHLFQGGDPPRCEPTVLEEESPSCDGISRKAVEAGRHEALADYWRAAAACDTLSALPDVDACRQAAKEELTGALSALGMQLATRLDRCQSMGHAPRSVAVDPRNFVTTIDHRHLPLSPGRTLLYATETAEGTKFEEVTVTSETKEILGVECVVVKDVEIVEGEVVEETVEWFAQDADGNVWCFGEESFDYEGSEVVDWTRWEAGDDGAGPGMIMEADPQAGDIYYEEFVVGVSEDVAEVVSVTETVSLSSSSVGPYEDCVQIVESSILEGSRNHKYFAPGVGMVFELDVETGERTELVEATVTPEK